MPVPKIALKWVLFCCCLVLFFTAWGLQSFWMPKAKAWAAQQIAASSQSNKEQGEVDHAGHDQSGHDHAGHDESSSLELSSQARKNIGLTKDNVRPVTLQNFTRTISVPAIIVERPGRTRIKIVAPMTGIVTNINVISGEAIMPGRELFNLQLTHEDMVQAQASFLKTLGDLDVENKEITRLIKITNDGAIAGKVLLERKYAKQKLEVTLSAQREALYLHGFSTEQVKYISEKRRLLKDHQIFAPKLHNDTGEVQMHSNIIRRISATEEPKRTRPLPKNPHSYIVQELSVSKGDFVSVGDTLCILADFRELYIQGRAFEYDAEELTKANNEKWTIQAVRENRNKEKKVIDGLKIAYLDNQIEPNSRAFVFYVNLPNKILGETTTSAGHRFLNWEYKPGQRLQLRVPIERITQQIVIPVNAIASEGADRFVFIENGSHFDRKPVHVLYQDQLWVVIANDGSIFPGDVIAFSGAHQMQMALKNKAGGAVNPHAGHHH